MLWREEGEIPLSLPGESPNYHENPNETQISMTGILKI